MLNKYRKLLMAFLDVFCINLSILCLPNEVAGQTSDEAKKPGNALALGVEMLSDYGMGAGRICFEKSWYSMASAKMFLFLKALGVSCCASGVSRKNVTDLFLLR